MAESYEEWRSQECFHKLPISSESRGRGAGLYSQFGGCKRRGPLLEWSL